MSRRASRGRRGRLRTLGFLVTLLMLAIGGALAVAVARVGGSLYEYWREGLTFGVVTASLGYLIGARLPQHRIGLLLSLVGGSNAIQVTAGGYAALAAARSLPAGEVAAWVANLVRLPTFFSIFLLFLWFPTGQPPSREWRWVGRAVAVGAVLVAGSLALSRGPMEDFSSVDNPFGLFEATPLSDAGNLILVGALFASIASLVVRFVRSRDQERQQLKWFVFAVGLALGGLLLLGLLEAMFPWFPRVDEYGSYAWTLLPMTIFAAMAVAILRYRLYDIDLVINRTLVYGAVTAILGLGYVGSVVVLGGLLRPLAGSNDLAVAGSTLAVAALFSPARRRIQAFVDRRFYRRRYNAARTVEAFSARLRDEVDLETLRADLTGVVRETLQPASVSVWLRE